LLRRAKKPSSRRPADRTPRGFDKAQSGNVTLASRIVRRFVGSEALMEPFPEFTK
jgi:hypothetical protein